MTAQDPAATAATLAAAGPKALPSDDRANRANEPGGANEDVEVLPRLLGRYALLRLMVRGGMGEVFLATTIGIEGAERPCVVKRIRRDYREDPSFQARFLDEARVQAQLDDPGVARILEASVDDGGDPYVVVEYVEGRSLADVRTRIIKMGASGGKPMPWADAVAVTLEIASALTHVHERTGADGAPLGIVHRDLSPQNVMVGFSGDVKLIDFGTARGENRKCHTVSGTVLAKPGYCAPEVAKGESATARADIYALGVMLWELVAGKRFLQGDTTEHVAKVAEGSLRPSALAGDPKLAALGDGPVPAELDHVIAWMTEPIASQRCPRAREAAKTLAGILGGAPRRPVEERGVRARVKAMLARLYPGEPSASRVDFARLVARARRMLVTEPAVDLTPNKTNENAGKHADGSPLTGVPNALPGTRYRLIRRIGEGAMGVVFEGEHVDLGRKVAVKVLQAKHSSSQEFVARFRREARAIAGLMHPNLVHVYDFGQTSSEDGGRLFFVMEKLDGETLDAYLEREKGVDWRDACEIAIKTCRALEAAHAAGLVHRDLKPANLFLTYAGRPPSSLAEVGLKLLDFGVAKGSHEIGALADDPNLSHAGAIFGTPETMAPEQVSASVVDGRADLYALGCVLYHLVTGRPVFEAPSPILMMSCHLRETPRPPRKVAPARAIPESVEKVILRALEKDPTRRFADASDMREALEEACYGGFYVDQQATPRGPEEEALDIMVELGLDDVVPMRPMDAAPLDDDRVASRIDPNVDPRFRDGRVVDLADEETPVSEPVPRKKSRSALWFAALLGLSFLGTAGWMRRDVVKRGWEVAKHEVDRIVNAPIPMPKRSEPPVTMQTVATKPPAPAPAPAPVPAPTSAPTPAIAPVPAPPLATTATTTTTDTETVEAPKKGRRKDKKAKKDVTADAVPAPTTTATSATPSNASVSDAEAKLAAGDPDAALTLARVAVKNDPSIAALRIWARAAYAAGHPMESHQACLSWLAKAGDDLDAKMLDARALHSGGHDDEARERLDDVLKTHPGCGEAKSMKKDLEALLKSMEKTKGAAPFHKPKRRTAKR
jgi:serine/threonine-protein kinase